MLARADSLGMSGPSAAAPAAFPPWARAKNRPDSEAEAAFLAGAALARLDATLRENPPWAGVFRQRLALAAAAVSVVRAGRAEDQTALRDAFHLTRPGADPGPAGQHLLAWRELVARPAGQWRSSIAVAAEVLAVPNEEALQQAIDAVEAGAGGARPAPFAAAQVFAFARRALTPSAGRRSLGGRGGEGELLAAWLADGVLAQRLKWPFALPLLAAPLFAGGDRRATGGLADGAETARVLFATARAAARACDLSAELGRRAQRLFEAAPKLRAKGAGAALLALLDDDSLSVSSKIDGPMSERGARRLFDRLVALGAIRELTGRATFRLYGL
jgi:Protein of unknown function (DUF1403)